MTSWLTLLFWVLAHSLWQAALVWALYRAFRLLRPALASRWTSALATLALFSIPALTMATAISLVSQALAGSPQPREDGALLGLLPPLATWGVAAVLLLARLISAMRASVADAGSNGDSPCVAGWLRPRIVIPHSLAERLPADQLQGVIAHEQEHIRAGDAWINLVQCWLDVCYFFNPAYRALSRAARQEREFRCDDAAAGSVGTLTYLRALAEVARHTTTTAPSPCLLRAGGDLERRVARLAAAASAPPARGRLEFGAALAAVFVLLTILPDIARVPARHVHASAWQTRMVPAGQFVRGIVVPPLQSLCHALKHRLGRAGENSASAELPQK